MTTSSGLLILLFTACSAQHLPRVAVEISPLPAGPDVAMPAISVLEAAGFVERALTAVNERLDVQEPAMFTRGAVLTGKGAAWFMAASHSPRPATRNLTRVALVAEEASKYIAHA
jgi:hypothetical protein